MTRICERSEDVVYAISEIGLERWIVRLLLLLLLPPLEFSALHFFQHLLWCPDSRLLLGLSQRRLRYDRLPGLRLLPDRRRIAAFLFLFHLRLDRTVLANVRRLHTDS